MTILLRDRCAAHALAALSAYAQATAAHPVDATTAVDLVTDLAHFCRQQGHDAVGVVASGIAHWVAEEADPDGLTALPEVAITITPTDV